jgi:hypothetical protein
MPCAARSCRQLHVFQSLVAPRVPAEPLTPGEKLNTRCRTDLLHEVEEVPHHVPSGLRHFPVWSQWSAGPRFPPLRLPDSGIGHGGSATMVRYFTRRSRESDRPGNDEHDGQQEDRTARCPAAQSARSRHHRTRAYPRPSPSRTSRTATPTSRRSAAPVHHPCHTGTPLGGPRRQKPSCPDPTRIAANRLPARFPQQPLRYLPVYACYDGARSPGAPPRIFFSGLWNMPPEQDRRRRTPPSQADSQVNVSVKARWPSS